MGARSATVGDLEAVFHDLSKRMADEYDAAGKDSKAAYDNLMMDLKEGRAHALVENDTAVAIIAWHEHGGAAHTLFSAKDNFFSAKTVRVCKQHIRQVQALTGNLPIYSSIEATRMVRGCSNYRQVREGPIEEHAARLPTQFS